MKKIITNDSRRVEKWVSERLDTTGGFASFEAVGLEKDGELVAGIVYDYFTGTSINAHIAAVPGRHWATPEFLHFGFWYPFEQLGVKRITGLVPASNLEARRLDEHLGFELEAVLKDAHRTGDILVYRLWKRQCRYLDINVKYALAA